ncbi:FecR family protein [Dyadobacter fermentans]|uniref:Anti-FecI sigma factor, FecR n=1 Tax=Dyadobacter fermentans (strain ATCC 700827 / DSM 18053 / CIP 107007 / KCTC 52180 / NS114) TaxID=471854 RepID=C6VSS8_DYAFD|nr:FecR family protein [Dyadobacter fermentans]ACT92900.1 anti-FecI sigma factor, FecR [Dyadobacter fermentans DSM 18053]
MTKKNFYTLLKRYQAGTCTDQEKRLVEQWFLTLDEEIPHYDSADNEAVEERIWTAIQQRTDDRNGIFNLSWWKWAAAAVVLLVAGWATYRYQATQPPSLAGASAEKVTRKNLVTNTNQSNAPKAFQLPDGSEIRLSPKSSISYEPRFDGVQREVYLEGNAFFHVRKDSRRPFLVHTGDVVTKVLGTSFWVKGMDNNSAIEVSVVTGKVAVSQHTGPDPAGTGKVANGVILTANQRVKYTSQTHTFETGLVAAPVPMPVDKAGNKVSGSFDFQESPFSEVIGKIEEAYGIEIILEDETIKGCMFSGNITRQPLFTKLDLLCNSINASYEVRGTRILISGKGCSGIN